MTLDWTTFLLEIANFAILLWLLKRFLYRPVMNVIARRQAAVAKDLADAQSAQQQATNLQRQYENRLADWQREKTQNRAALQESLNAEAAHQRQALQAQLDAEREKHRVQEERRLEEAQNSGEQQALAQGARFAARLLKAVASPDLEAKLVTFMLAELARLPADRTQALQQGLQAEGLIEVLSAFPLADEQRRALRQAIDQLTGGETSIEFREDPALLAGLRIQSGAWVFGGNLQDELQAFAEIDGHAS